MQYIYLIGSYYLHDSLIIVNLFANMINPFRYFFVETISWSQTIFRLSDVACSVYDWHSHSGSFSFSTILAGTIMIDCTGKSKNVQLWDTATGAATWSFEDSSFVAFSPTEPAVAALVRSDVGTFVRSGSVHMVKRDSWKTRVVKTSHDSTLGTVCAFNSNGKTIVMSWDKKHLKGYDPTHLKLVNTAAADSEKL